jgi:hypothetical protein
MLMFYEREGRVEMDSEDPVGFGGVEERYRAVGV